MISSGKIGFGRRSTGLWLVFWLLLLTNTHSAFGQNVSSRGNFETDVISGCAPLTVTPNTLFSGSIGSVQYFYDNTLDPLACSENYQTNPGACVNGTLSADTQFTYNTPGTYFLVQIIGTNSTPEVDFIEITVIEPVQPSFTTTICENNQVILTFDFTQDNYDFYEVDFGDSQPVATLDKTGTNELTYNYTSQGTYNIEVRGSLNNGSVANCGVATPVAVTTLETIPTPEITSLTVTSTNTFELSYATLTEGVVYNLYLNENGGGFSQVMQIDPVANSQILTFTSSDPGVDFNFGQYGIRIGASDPCAASDVFSNTIQNIRAGFSASYMGNNLILSRGWSSQDPDALLADVILNYDGNNETLPVSVMGNSDITLNSCVDARPFYFEATFGAAISRSLTITPDLSMASLTPPPPIGLAGQITNSSLMLSYDAAPVTATEYRISRVDQSGSTLEGTTNNLSFNVTNFSLGDSEICFTVTYVDECGHESAAAEPVCFQFTSSIQVPNAFTPDGDGHNDTFNIPNGIFLDFRMEVYNRWGSLLFVTTDASVGWDGLINGQMAPPGTYVYRINYNSGQNTPVSLTGSFILIR